MRFVHETDTSLHAVGLMYVLPRSELPFEVELTSDIGATQYWVRVGIADDFWKSLTESKRSKAVDLYASRERDEVWSWSEPVSGRVTDT